MEGKRLLQSIRTRNLLSFGGAGEEITLEPLNVLIGPNASGKSNLIEVVGLLQAAAADLTAPIRDGGGIGEWLWKGGRTTRRTPIAEIEVIASYPDGQMPLRHRVAFTMVSHRLELIEEAVEDEPKSGLDAADMPFYYRYQRGNPVVSLRPNLGVAPLDDLVQRPGRMQRQLRREDISPDQSVLSQRRDPDIYSEITYLARQYQSIRLYREWNLGRYTAARLPEKPDLPSDFLQEDAGNLALILNDLLNRPSTKRLLIDKLKEFYDAAEDITTLVQGGTVQLFVHERGLEQPIPATRLSDGTLRYLCLLAVLCHPEPPPLVCIEEPELGMHPDVLPAIGKLLLDASGRTQLIVTTHSVSLVSALTDVPEAVLVCERGDMGTRLRRLKPQHLESWLKDYSLGEVWQMGEIGGTRW